MALLGRTQLGLSALILTVFLGLSSTGEGFKQEMWLYPEGGGALYFDTHVPDLSVYSSVLPKITSYCVNGWFTIYSTVNYQTHLVNPGLNTGKYYCSHINVATAKSLRYLAANDTSIDAISLYPRTGWMTMVEGEEIYVTARARTNIPGIIAYVVASGKSDWMLFEGQSLDGKSKCLSGPDDVYFAFSDAVVSFLNMTTIGSVFKGCDEKDIQLYRESNFL